MIAEEIRSKVASIISQGLVTGMGVAEPGKLCLEAAICLALGEKHGDRPSCVAEPDRRHAIRLQDAYPGTPQERAKLFLPLGLAQLGTAGTDRRPWVKLVADGTIRKVVPMALRAASGRQAEPHKANLLEAAARCEAEGTKESARHANKVALAAAAAHAADAADYAADAADAADYAAHAADYAADCADYAAAAADDDAAACAARQQVIKTAVAVALEAYAAEGRS